MPPLPPAGPVVRVDLNIEPGGDANALCRLHFSYTGGPPSTSDLNSLATTIRGAFNTNLKAFFDTSTALEHVQVVDLSSSTGAGGIDTTAVTGTRAGSLLPGGSAVLINHRIARRYRGGKPRTYLPAFTASDVTNRQGWLSASVTALQTGWNNFIAAINGVTVGSTVISGFVNVSYYSAKALRTTPHIDAITASVVSFNPASQRRRNRSS